MMVGLWILIIMLCLLIATGSTLIALRLQYRLLDQSRQEREAWRQAQESRQRTWEIRQGKHILEAEKKLADQLKEARREWHEWSIQLEQNQLDWQARADIEKEVARLPHVEHLELPLHTGNQRQRPASWRPPTLYRANLSKRDLSYRYMERADLREADLAEANFYMADLSGASLAGANLARANLTSANLSGADLRGANLSGASLLVADLHNAVLHGAILLGARHLSTQQLQEAIYDSTTVIDSAVDITLPRIPGVQVTPADLLSITQPMQKSAQPSSHTPAEHFNEAAPTAKAAASSAVPADIAPTSETATVEQSESPAPVIPTEDVAGEETSSAIPAGQEMPLPAANRETEATLPANAPEMPSPPTNEPAATPDVDQQGMGEANEESDEKVQSDSRKIIQLSTHTSKAAQTQGTRKRSNATKRAGRKSKNTAHREKSS